MKKINKWTFDYVIQGYYGQGWEDATTEETFKAAKVQLKCYNDNEPSPHRLIKRRRLTEEYIEQWNKIKSLPGNERGIKSTVFLKTKN